MIDVYARQFRRDLTLFLESRAVEGRRRRLGAGLPQGTIGQGSPSKGCAMYDHPNKILNGTSSSSIGPVLIPVLHLLTDGRGWCIVVTSPEFGLGCGYRRRWRSRRSAKNRGKLVDVVCSLCHSETCFYPIRRIRDWLLHPPVLLRFSELLMPFVVHVPSLGGHNLSTRTLFSRGKKNRWFFLHKILQAKMIYR